MKFHMTVGRNVNTFYTKFGGHATSFKDTTLCSKASDTSKTFIAPKVFILCNSDWFYLIANNLPFIHAKFHSTG